jgi:hypothetical protein
MRRRQAVLGLWGSMFLALLAPSCVSEKPNLEPSEEVKKLIVDTAPDKMTELNVNFDDKVTLLGVTVDPGLDVAPGKRVNVTMYWRADKPVEAGWKLFTHVLDGSGDRLMNIDNVGPLRQTGRNGQAWPPSNWTPGKIYTDTQTFSVPRKVKSSKLQVVAGIWKGRERLTQKSGPSAGDNRALVVTLNTVPNASAKTTRVPRLDVARLSRGSSIRIDGKLDEAAWRDAADSSAFVNVRTGEAAPESPVQGSAKLAWDDKWLYLGFTVKDQNVTGGFDKKQADPQLWTKDCVEIMIDPDGNGDNKDYYEIQINPQNLVFDSQFDEYNRPRQEPNGPFGHQEWSSKLESAVKVQGTLDNDKDKDDGYVVEVRIPWVSFDKAKESPPKPGASWRLNLYAMQDNQGVAWSPILEQGNFHKASRFGRVGWVTSLPVTTEATPTSAPRDTQAAASRTGGGAEPGAAAASSTTAQAKAPDLQGLSVTQKALEPRVPPPAPVRAPAEPAAEPETEE